MPFKSKKKYLIIGILGVTIFIACATFIMNFNNFHVVLPNKIYRSAQLNAKTLQSVITQHHIRSIINLRGFSAWYFNEKKVADQNHVELYTIPLSAIHYPSPSSMTLLIHTLQKAPKPILIHCRSGADRSGLVSAMALILAGYSLSKANEQISWKYLAVSPNSLGRLVMPLYEQWLSKNHYASSTQTFIEWATLDYQPPHLSKKNK